MCAFFDNGRDSDARAARLEVAAAILWAQALRNDPDPPFIKLLDGHWQLLLAGLQLDASLTQCTVLAHGHREARRCSHGSQWNPHQEDA